MRQFAGFAVAALLLGAHPGEAQQAADAAGNLQLYILIAGNQEISHGVTVTAQSIAPGTEVSTGTTITLTFTDTAAADG